MYKKIIYLYSKIVVKLQIPSMRECCIDNTSKIGSRSNLIRVDIGKHSYVGANNSIINTQIGAFCSISSYCSIGGGEHPINWVSTSPCFYQSKTAVSKGFSNNKYQEDAGVWIGNDVWIGEKCFIKAGVKVGNGVIIGAHSVVTKDIPDYAIVAGVPARIIRYRFDKETISKLVDSEWWNWEDSRIKEMSNSFNNVESFFEQISKVK